MANENDPNDADAQAFLAEMNFGEMDEAEYNDLLEKNPDFREFLEEEQKAFFAGELSLAQMMDVDPKDLIAVANIGADFISDKEWEAAEDIFAGLTAIEPAAPLFHLGLASARQGGGNAEGALEALNECIALCDDGTEEPDESAARREFESLADALYMRGMIHVDAENAEGALADLRRVCDLIDDPDDPIAESCLSMIATLLGGEEGATAALEADIDEEEPDESVLAEHPELGESLEQDITDVAKGEIPAAVLAGTTDKELAGAAESGFTLLENGRFQDAHDIFAGLAALDPNVAIFQVALGNACESLRDDDGALEAYDAACAIAAELPEDKSAEAFDPYYYRGKYHLKVGNGEQALEDLTKAIECEPDVENPLTQHAAVLVSAMMTAAEEAN